MTKHSRTARLDKLEAEQQAAAADDVIVLRWEPDDTITSHYRKLEPGEKVTPFKLVWADGSDATPGNMK